MLISEFQPNPTGGDPSTQLIEISGTPGEDFSGVIVNIDADGTGNSGEVNPNDTPGPIPVTGTFDANGLLVVEIDDFENPSFTIVLSSEFPEGLEDIDVENDGVIDDISVFGTVFDAIGVPDDPADEVFLIGELLGGTDFTFTGDEPQLIFRESNDGAFFAINDPANGQVFDTNGNDVTPAIFDIDPIADSDPTAPPVGPGTFGTNNPAIAGTVVVIGDVAEFEGNAGDTTILSFTASRLGDIEVETTVDFAITPVEADADDFGGTLPVGGTLTFAVGEDAQAIEIAVSGDDEAEFLETFTVTLSNASGGAVIAVDTGTGSILGDDPFTVTIPEIQGDGFVSTFADSPVVTTGVVTAVADDGFYLLDPAGDGNAATSDGIFVSADGDTFPVVVGNEVTVSGTVVENPAGGLTVTQINADDVTVDGTAETLPAPVLIGGDGIAPPTVGPNFDPDLLPEFVTNPDGTIGFEQVDFNDPAVGNAQPLQPDLFAADFWESLEGVVVTLNDAVQVSETDGNGQIYALADQGAGSNNFNARGGLTLGVDATDISTADSSGERIQIDLDDALVEGQEQDELIAQGAILGNVTGAINYSFGEYELLPTELVERTPVALEPEVTALAGDEDTLLVAAYNVLNLDAPEASDDPAIGDRFDAIGAQIVTNLNTPDIIALQEIQDNDGPGDADTSDVTAADVTLQLLVDAITDAGGPTYEFIDNTFIGDDTNGGQGGGNIRTAFLYNPARVDFVEGSDAPVTDPVTQSDGITGNNPFEGSRIPLAADFTFNGETVTVISVHNQAGGANDFDNEQPRFSGSTDDRNQESAEINSFVDDILAADPDANVIVAGDFNDFEFQPWAEFLDGSFDGSEPILFNAIETLPELEQYSFQFTGNEAGNHVILDHIFATADLFANLEGTDVVHVNSEFPNATQASDHDPVLTTFTIADAAPADAAIVADLGLGIATTGIDFIGEVLIPTGTLFTDDTLGEVEIGGLSGLEFDPATGEYFALSDTQEAPQRFFTIDLVLEEDALVDVVFNDAVQILSPDGDVFADGSVDPESIRLGPSSAAPDDLSLYFTSETGGGFTDVDDDIPFINEILFDGSFVRTIEAPAGFAATADDSSGIRNNNAFESLSFSPDGTSFFTATEAALFQDGPVSSLTESSPSRVVEYDTATGEAIAQFIYEVDPIPFAPDPVDSFADNGLVEILAISDTEFIFVERSFAVGVGNTIRIFSGDLEGATDVSALDSIVGADVTPIEKTLLFDTASLGIDPDNIEGITFGPTLEDGKQTFFLVSDNNFNGPQVTQFLGFTLDTSFADVEVEAIGDVSDLAGSDLDDFLTGDENDNVLEGNGGDDFLNGLGGSDTLNGGTGDDTIVSDALDTIDGGENDEGGDTVDFSTLEAGIIVDLDVESAGPMGTPGQNGGILLAGPMMVDGVEPEDNISQEIDDIENIIGTDFDDLLLGNNESNTILAGAGNDTLAGIAMDDFLDGGDGIDTALFTFAPAPLIVDLAITGPQDIGPPGTDTLINIENVSGSNFASDTILGNEEDNVLSSLAFDDVLDGRGGNDTLDGGEGNDTVSGGAGDDTIISDALDVIDGGENGEGGDTVDFSGAAAGIIIDLDINTPAPGPESQDGGLLDAPPAAGGQVLLEVDDIENVIGTDFDDGLFGNNEVNVLEGLGGNDIIHSFGGADTLDGGEGTDTALFSASPGVTVDLDEAGNATSSFGDTLIAIENLTGSASGPDDLAGNSGDNVLNGQGGDDILAGEGGNDTLDGGEGTDTAVFVGNQADFEIELEADGSVEVEIDGTEALLLGIEVISFDDGDVNVADLVVDDDGDILELIVGTAGDDEFFGGDETPDGTLFDAIEALVISGAGEDEIDLALAGEAAEDNIVLSGSDSDAIFASTDDIIFGGSGNDTIVSELGSGNRISGGAGDDEFLLGGSNDRVLGGAGNDTFTAFDGGDNLLAGGAGEDIFRIVDDEGTPTAANTILDFEIGADSIEVAASVFGEGDLTLDAGSNDIVLGGNTLATLLGVDVSTLSVGTDIFFV